MLLGRRQNRLIVCTCVYVSHRVPGLSREIKLRRMKIVPFFCYVDYRRKFVSLEEMNERKFGIEIIESKEFLVLELLGNSIAK